MAEGLLAGLFRKGAPRTLGRRKEARSVLKRGIPPVFENLVPPAQDGCEATLRALRRKVQRLARQELS